MTVPLPRFAPARSRSMFLSGPAPESLLVPFPCVSGPVRTVLEPRQSIRSDHHHAASKPPTRPIGRYARCRHLTGKKKALAGQRLADLRRILVWRVGAGDPIARKNSAAVSIAPRRELPRCLTKPVQTSQAPSGRRSIDVTAVRCSRKSSRAPSSDSISLSSLARDYRSGGACVKPLARRYSAAAASSILLTSVRQCFAPASSHSLHSAERGSLGRRSWAPFWWDASSLFDLPLWLPPWTVSSDADGIAHLPSVVIVRATSVPCK